MTKSVLAVLISCSLIFPALAIGAGEEGSQPGAASGEQLLITKLLGCDRCEKEKAAFLLGSQKCPKAVIPLMTMLHQDKEESSRIVAALSLCLLGDERGTFAVKRAAQFDDSARVRMLCAWYYNQYVSEGTFSISRQVEPPRTLAVGSN